VLGLLSFSKDEANYKISSALIDKKKELGYYKEILEKFNRNQN